MNIGVHISFWISVFVFFGQTPRSGIAGAYGSSIFNFLKNVHTIFCSGYTNLQPHQQCTRVPFSPHPHKHLLFLVFLIIVILKGVRGYLIVVLIFTSLRINKVDYLVMYLLAICIIFFGKMSIQIFCSVFNWLFFLLLSCMSSLYILDINPSSDIWFANIFSYSIGCLFIFLMVFFAVQKLSGVS